MKKTLFAVLPLSCALMAHAQYFTNGNLAVVRIGGTGEAVTTSDSGNSVWIDQYTTAGTLVSSFPIPTNGPGALVLHGQAYEGLLTLTPDGTHLVLGGFHTSLPYISNGVPTNVGFSYSATVPRAIATIDGYGNYALPIANMNMFNTYTITSAASDGSNFWAEGTGATGTDYGVVYAGTAQDPATNEVVTGLFGGGGRALNIYNNALYAMAYPSNTAYTAGGFMLANLNGALPTNTATYSQAFSTGTAAASTPSDLVINPAGTIAYVADYSFGIVKFTNSGLPDASWISNYTIIPTNQGYSTASGSSHAISVTADFTQNPVVVYATTGETLTNRLVMLQDTGPGSVVMNLASNVFVTGAGGSTNTFRGVRFVPGSAPQISASAQPVSVAQSANGTATFAVTPTGTPPFTYQWFSNSVPVPGGTNSALTLSGLTTFQNGTEVYVTVTGPYGTATSSNATLSVSPSYFSPGNLAVVRIGGPGEVVTTSDSGNTVWIDQYTTSGGLVSSYAIPSTGPDALVLHGQAYEGLLTLTPDGTHLVLGGFHTSLPYISNGVPTNVGFSYSATVPRAIATIDGYGNYALPIANMNMFNTYTITSAASDGSNFWAEGTGATGTDYGVVYAGTAQDPATNEVVTGLFGGGGRALNIYNNALYAMAYPSNTAYTAGGFMLANLNGALPTNTATYSQAFSTGTAAASTPSDLVINPAGTIAYVADYSFGIVKFTNSGLPDASWISNYTIIPTNQGYSTASGSSHAISVTADFTQNPVVVYATTGETLTNRLVMLQDTGPGSVVMNLASNVFVTGAGGSTNTFRGVRFVPGEPPMITSVPEPVIQDAGGSATFTVAASGTPALSYQWYTNNAPVVGANDSSLTLSDLNTNQNGSMVYAVVSNNFGSATSASAQLTVQPPGALLSVSLSPTTETVSAGGTATFTIAAIGAPTSAIWSLNGVPLTDGGSVSGSSTPTLTISPAYATYDGTYTAVASNSFGAVAATNSARLTVIDPVVEMEPLGSTNLPGLSTNLSVTAIGSGPLTYQWFSNGVAIAGATMSSLALANNGATSAGTYFVVISNALGNVITSAVTTVSFTPFLLSDTFSYPNGNLFGDPGSPWKDINGTNPELVTNDRVQINQTNYTTDAQSLFSQPVSGTVVWASFIVNVSTIPTNRGGVYFANLEDTNFGFYGRIFALTSNNPSYTPNISPTAFPGTYRLGIANAQGDSTGTGTTGPNAVVPLDLAPGIDYQVVYLLDVVNDYSALAINPASIDDVGALSPGGVSSGPATDSFTPTLPIAAFGLRQREGEGVLQLDNLEVSFDWNGTGSGYTAVTAGVTPVRPVIGLQPIGFTNYAGNSNVLEVAASGIGTPRFGLTYAWYQNGAPLTDGSGISGSATPTLTLDPTDGTNSGTYYVVVTGAAGGPVQSSNAVVFINTNATAPYFTTQPLAALTNSEGGTVTLTSSAVGTGPISYAWYFNDNPLGVTTPDLTLTSLSTNESGTYYVVATGGTGEFTQSSNAVLTVTGPKSVTIGYLRSLLNPTTYEPSDETTLFSITGVITTGTNQTTGDTASYYIQDSTGGINLFVTFGSDFRPNLGDEVTATGTLSSYVDNYEMDVNEGQTGFADKIVGTNYPLPAPILLPWGYTAPLPADIATSVEGSVVMLTNLYFELGGGGNVFASGVDYIVTNNTGESYTIFVSDQDTNLVTGKPIPAFADSIAGPLIQDDTTVGISFTVYSNLVTAATAPPSINVTAMFTGVAPTNFTLSWTANSSSTYSVLASTNVAGPYIPIASGLSFSTGTGAYTDLNATNTTEFYKIASP